jgi:hypothetical protein
VLFEETLRCNPKTDHLAPKVVYPLYQKQIETVLSTIGVMLPEYIRQHLAGLAVAVPQLFEEIEQGVAEYNLELTKDILRMYVEDDVLVKAFNASNAQHHSDMQNLFKQIMNMREQLEAKKKTHTVYKADFMQDPDNDKF